MNYWIISPNVTAIGAEQPLWEKAIIGKQLAIIGWDEDNPLGLRFIDDIQIGDFILIAQGANKNKRIFSAGIVASDAISELVEDTPREAYNRRLNPVWSKEDLEKLNLNFTGAAYGDADRIPALYMLHPDKNEADKNITDKIELDLTSKIKSFEIQEKIKLLEYKYQIILQGPPGTGKTFLAKLMAEEMTKSKPLGSPIQKIDDFFKTFDPSDLQNLKKRGELKELLSDFQKKFPKENLSKLTLEDYAIGTGSNDSFCWWIERGLKPLGYYFPGSARSYLFYWSKQKDNYSKHGKFLHDTEDNVEAMKKVAQILSTFVSTKNFKEASQFFGESFLLKILHSYFPDNYSPINSVPCLNNALKLFEVDYSKMNTLQKNIKLQDLYLEKKKEFKSDITNLEFMRFMFDAFDLKGTVSVQSNELISTGEFKIIQFHPAYSYEDFIRGISAHTNDKGQVEYKVENKVLADFAQKALDNPSANFVLVIDEINRANLPAVLGELIYALEYRYDETKPKQTTVESMYVLKTDETDSEGNKDITLPKNLYIIGTMNTADRSVGHIDYAIRRRFAFVDVLPSATVIDEVVKDPVLNKKAKDLFAQVSALFYEKNDTINSTENQTVYLQSDFKAKDVQLGHSYFLVENEEQLKLKLKYEIKPLLLEYVNDGILNESAMEKIENLC